MRDSRHSVGEHWIVLGSCLLPGLGSFIDTILVLVLTVGSWLTPITQGLNPAQVDAGVESTVQIAGDNFQENMTVRLGGVRLIRVRLLDEHRLEVELPATLLPGLY
ncbi:MAG TPA: hypothetical protein PKE45_14810, partial [Caldilineaceae bacterium]|nr:hypothetical protein [Caldilineaceae bacterium]